MSLVGLHPLGTARLRAGLASLDRSFPEELRAQVAEHDLPEEALWLAWEIARLSPQLSSGERRATLLLVLATLIAEKAGSTRLPLPDASGSTAGAYLDALLSRLRVSGADARMTRQLALSLREDIGPAFAPIFGGPSEYRPLIIDRGHLYAQRMLHHELRVVATVGERLRAAPFDLPKGAIEAALAQLRALAPVLGGAAVALSDEQETAVRAALTGRLTVISGGPGTGKTSIVVSILRALVRLGIPIEEVALAAPTGRAAKRMDESIRRTLAALPAPAPADALILAGCAAPRTLHRLLGASATGEHWKHHEGNPLAEAVVIVDECSMVDLFLMDRLARSVRPDARLILLGDADQLPSVDAGAVLRDLLPELLPDGQIADDPRARAAHRLSIAYRMQTSDAAGEEILTVARLINAGEGPRLFEAGERGAPISVRASAADLVLERVELLPPGPRGAERQAFLARWYEERVRGPEEMDARAQRIYPLDETGFSAADRADLAALFHHFEGFRLLCVTRGDGRPTGAEAVNLALHRLAAQRSTGANATTLWPGEPVMMHRNDHDRGLFNGDQGLILRVAEVADGGGRPQLRAVFPRGDTWAVFHLDALRADLGLAYAITVHKGQGSELDHVGVILPDAPLPILTRELLYTAVTRSRRSVTLVGSEAVLVAGAAAQLHRFSGIGERLAGAR